MQSNQIVLQFLSKLSQNNSKEWMDANRNQYHLAKENWLAQVQELLDMLCQHDPAYFQTYKPKQCISRITNNRMFRPDLPPYKNHFNFSVMDKADGFSPLHISVGGDYSFIGCGYHHPDSDMLKSIRSAIDYNGGQLKAIMEDEDFVRLFGGMSNFSEQLKTSPRGYSKDHEFIDLLRYKSFTIAREISEEEIISDDFTSIVEETYLAAKPFGAYLKEATSVLHG